MTEHTDPTPFAGDVANYALDHFADDLRAELAPAEIEMRLAESQDGTRTVSAWQTSDPGTVATFPMDDLRFLPYQVDIVARAIRRSFAAPGTAERALNQPATGRDAAAPHE